MENTNITISLTADELLIIKLATAEMFTYVRENERVYAVSKEYLPTEEAEEEFFSRVFPEGTEDHVDEVDKLSPRETVELFMNILNKLANKENK